ncbi:MAG TPA: NrfD/PsrC family molybdoenzyme membrane anchor subunit [Vicinamibacteria bacterium]|nr:NrfD/PsrC family molybdoenzyme membrane anchor subunit [Vicinamibacteria bacterium]
MTELYTTARSPIVEPHLQVWGWEIPVYLFLGGFTAGLLVLSGWALWRGRRSFGGGRGAGLALASGGTFLLGLMAISAGMLALFLDLTHKPYFWRLYVTFEPRSPMSWGSWILLLVYPVLLAGVLLDPPARLLGRVPGLRALARRLERTPGARRAVGVLAMGAGALLGIYTGILLSALGARPLWSSALLGPLFLVSGLSAGAAFGHLVSPDAEERTALARADNALLAAELALIVLLLIGLATSTRAHAEAAALLLGGPFTAVFWVVVVGLGIVLPFAIQSLSLAERIRHTPLAPLLVLAGGLALRFVIVYAGQASRWPRL